MTSRSFSEVIKELARTICHILVFYLIAGTLGLLCYRYVCSTSYFVAWILSRTMKPPDEINHSNLSYAKFHVHMVMQGWNFDGSRPNEKDRQMLVEYDINIGVAEVNLLLPQ